MAVPSGWWVRVPASIRLCPRWRVGLICGRSCPAKGMAQRLPGPVLLRGSDRLGEEVHAVNAVGDVGIEALAAVHFFTRGPPGHVVVGGGVDVGEGLEEGLGMSAGKACAHCRQGAEVRAAGARVELVRLAVD